VLVLKRAAQGAYEDMTAAARGVRASDLEWTLVRIPRLTDAAGTGHPKPAYLGKGAGMRLSRSDLADFMLRETTEATYLRQAPVISS
jgi:hypothetical protein